MLDIHTHLIPLVDDGASSMEEAMEMVRYEVEQGVTVAYCTPHFRRPQFETPIEVIRAQFEALKKEIEIQQIPLQLHLGQEIYYAGNEGIDLIKMLQNGKLLTYEGEKKVLLEFPYTVPVEDLEEVLYRFSLHGYEVVIAHVERYLWMKKSHYQMMKDMGAKLQINADSVLGRSGLKQKKIAKHLLKLGMISYIASDIHSFRRPLLKKAMQKYHKYLK